MMINMLTGYYRQTLGRYGTLLLALALGLSGFMPILLQGTVEGAQLTSRKVTLATSQPDAAVVTYSFAFTTVSSTNIQSMSFQFCTTPLSTCTLPGGAGAGKLDVSHVTAAPGTWSGSQATAFTEYTGADAGGCTESDGGSGVATQYCVTRTETNAEAIGDKTFTITGISNPTIPSGNNLSIYIRMVIYSDTAFATAVHDGTVAASIVNQLNVTGRIQERLVFCVFALDDTAGSSSTVGSAATDLPTDCAANEANASTSVDIGVIDNNGIYKAPVDNSPPTSLGNDRYGAAIINTNASKGVAMTYFATASTAGGSNELNAFRVPGATCDVSGTSLLDQCFISADDSTGETFTAGTERFGLQLMCIQNSTTSTIGTTSNMGKDNTNLYVFDDGSDGSINTVYDAGRTLDFDDNGTDDCENDVLTEKYGWHDTDTTAQPLISSFSVVDDEMIKFRFGATAQSTTPTGTYTAASTYIATPTY
jgi:hypothetical protein